MNSLTGNTNPSKQFDPKVYIGKEIGNITLMSVLGQGAMGAVFIGYQKSLKRKVAVKIYPKSLSESGKMRLRLRDEAETVAVLNHPNIVPVFDMGETEDLFYITMQLIEGEDLREIILRQQLHPVPSRRVIPLQTCLQIMIHTTDALTYAHGEGVIHRDIKPANIMVDNRNNRTYLADFGIASSVLTEETPSDVVLGTPLYISPEQVWGKCFDNRTDIYSAGIVLFELILGKLPLSTRSLEEIMKIKLYNPETLFTLSPSAASSLIDKDLEKIILNATEPDPENRYFSCSVFHKDLVAYYERVFPDHKR
jgi:serine/threonine protein kinase